jgi:hypothetical protein
MTPFLVLISLHVADYVPNVALKTPNLANKFFFKKNFSDKLRSLKNNRNIFSLESLTDYFLKVVVEKIIS